MSLPLSVDEGFLFSLVDGVMTVDELCATASKTPEELAEILGKLVDLGAVDILEISDEVEDDEDVDPRAAAQAADTGEGELDARLRQDIMGMRLHIEQTNYYQMLGVAPNADRAEIRTAYFNLSKKFHPDNYYGTKLGRYREMMEYVFKEITEGYNTLSRKKRRVRYDEYIVDQIKAWEMERSLSGEAEAEAEPASDPSRPSLWTSDKGEAPGLEVFRFAPTPASRTPQPLVTPPPPRAVSPGVPVAPTAPTPSVAPPGASRPVSPAPRRPTTPAPRRPTTPAPRRPTTPAPRRPTTPAPRRPTTPAPPTGPAPSLGPESSRLRKMRARKGRDAIKALLQRRSTAIPQARPRVASDPVKTYGVDLTLEAPLFASSVEDGLAYRYAQAGLEALTLNDLSAAVNAFEVSVQLNPANRRVQEALDKVRGQAEGELSSTYIRQAEYEEEMGKYAQAAASFLKALQHKSDDHGLMYRVSLNLLHADKDLKQARGLARRAVGSQPSITKYRVTLAEIYLKLGMETEAQVELHEVQRIEPTNERAVRLMQGIGLKGS